MAKAIYKYDFNLLKKSEVTKYHPELLDVMSKYPYIELEDLKLKSIESYNFFVNVYSRVINEAVSEWVGALTQDIRVVDKSKKVKCELCNTNIINVCTIHNKYNGNKMNIGTECNNKFKFLNPNDVEDFLKKQNEIRKINKINTLLPNLTETMINWRRIISESDLYIFENISDRYIEIGEEVNDLQLEYVNKNISQDREDFIIDNIQKLLKESVPLRDRILHFLEDSKNNILYPTKKMVDSFKYSSNYETSKEFLDKDKKIQLRTLYRFRDLDYAKKVSLIFNEELKKEGARIIDVYKISKDNLGYNISFDVNKRCKFYYRYEYICELFGASVTGEDENIEEFNKESFLKKGELINNESIEEGLELMSKKLYYFNIEFIEYYNNFGEVLWKVLKDDGENAKFYYKADINKIKSVLKELLLSLKRYEDRDIYNILKTNSTKINNGEIKDFLKSRNRA
ncbi:hypothetical protein [Clostridium tertium]|jgi:hypothetical protein|uniref:hypothetical protein n=1 Tax=Clostridium tertium TaxID=1559 RepID=UPI001C1E4AB2|nr:hypothetical protein [Clostridium tertium]MBU6135194.1 hypothetical protein [Clostridium tertium]